MHQYFVLFSQLFHCLDPLRGLRLEYDRRRMENLEELRREVSPVAFQNAEWVAKNTAVGQKMFAMFSARVQKLLATK